MRVFVLTTGRTGSTTFTNACTHIENYACAHESRIELAGQDRLDYPDDHIEADNRLAWFTGLLAERFPDARYVHLTRNEEAVARSYVRRWEPSRAIRAYWSLRGTSDARLAPAFANGIIMRFSDWPRAERLAVSSFMVSTINANIRDFLRDRPHVTVRLENVAEDFSRFWDWIGAEGDREAALAEWHIAYNASTPSRRGQLR